MKQAFTGRAQIRDFELDFRTGELRSLIDPANEVLLREQPFQVLRMLVEREGKLVGREEIRRKLWPNSTIVDFDHSINVAIGILRKTLGDSAASPQYIETLARRGYRLLVPVQWLEPTTELPERDAPATQPLPQAGVLIGKKISQYRVLEVIGAGGMGLVYKAQDLRLGRAVALKGLPEEMANDQVALQRFELEAQTASALNHPNICTIYGIEEFEGQPFIAMELLEGESLAHRLLTSKPKAISLGELLEIAIQICHGLEAAHEKGIIHRDIKPANIYLTKQGPVKILDFGIAKLVGSDDETPNDPASPTETSALNLTRTGAAAGTAGYMSPEQVRKENLDARTDLFSFGLILYEMAAGQRAFTGATMAMVHDAILNEMTRPTHELNAAVPRRLDSVIDKALQKDRERRYQSAVEMRRDLERVRRESRPGRRIARRALALAALLVVLVTAAWFYWSYRNRVTLSETDTVVLADISNHTGDPVFDDALTIALRLGLEQTPYLNVLGLDKVLGTLALLKLPPTTKVTPEIARQICLRTNSKMVIANSIADAGNRFQIELNAINCESGRTVARVRENAARRNEVVQVLGESAAQLRSKLGEPASSLAQFNKPLAEATSSSLEALRAGMTGYKLHMAGDLRGAISNYQHAIELDPNCALAHQAVGVVKLATRERQSGVAALKKAYELRKRMTEPLRLRAEFLYYAAVTGEKEKACPVMSQAVQMFPRDAPARNNLSICLSNLGRPDRAADEAREAARLLPTPFSYAQLIRLNIYANRLNEAKATFADADARKFDGSDLRWYRALLAFLNRDDGALHEQWKWAEGKPDAARFFWGKAMVETYYGRFRSARTLRHQAVDLGTKPGMLPLASNAWPMYEAAVGNLDKARDAATQGLTTTKDHNAQLFLALALSQAGDTEQAQKLIDPIDKEFPLDTLIQYFYLPTIRAAIKLHENDPAGAVELLRPTVKYDLAYSESFQSLYPAYIRGLAYLQLGDGRSAAAEFQKLIDHPGIVGREVTGALSHLQLGRALKMMGDEAAARKSYEDFLNLWKNADPDIPIYQQAKAEYAKLSKR